MEVPSKFGEKKAPSKIIFILKAPYKRPTRPPNLEGTSIYVILLFSKQMKKKDDFGIRRKNSVERHDASRSFEFRNDGNRNVTPMTMRLSVDRY